MTNVFLKKRVGGHLFCQPISAVWAEPRSPPSVHLTPGRPGFVCLPWPAVIPLNAGECDAVGRQSSGVHSGRPVAVFAAPLPGADRSASASGARGESLSGSAAHCYGGMEPLRKEVKDNPSASANLLSKIFFW